jgi:hypothetical protein
MSDLQLGLLVIGAVAVVAVVAYNRLQERRIRRDAQQAFGSTHKDALLDEAPPAPRAVPKPVADPRADYVIDLKGAAPSLSQGWEPIERRFGPRAALSQAPDGGWQAALQMVSRNGVVGEADLLEFRTQVESLGASSGAAVSAPEMREALEAAYALDRACAEADVQVAVHVLGIPAEARPEAGPFEVAPRQGGVTLLLDVPRTRDLARGYEAMVRAGRSLAASHGGRLVDDNGNLLDDAALAAIGAEIDAMRRRMAEMGIEPGSPLALRLFS